MNQYFLYIRFNPGGGSIEVNSTTYDLSKRIILFIDGGSTVNIVLNLANGWTDPVSTLSGSALSTSASYSFTMPESDASIEIACSGGYVPVSTYGLKYSGTYKANYLGAPCLGFEIYQNEYVGSVIPVKVASLRKRFGNIGGDITETLIAATLDFSLATDSIDFFELLEGDNRTWKVRLMNGSDVEFSGFVSPDQITKSFSKGFQIYNLSATDGLDSFQTVRINNYTLPGNRAIDAIVGALNQTFLELRQTNAFCNIWETRMDPSDSVFEQFLTPDNTIWTDGEIAEFTDGVRVENETIYISEMLERMLRPFLCRLFIADDQFWIIRLPDYMQTTMNGHAFLADGSNSGAAVVDQWSVINCDVDRPELIGRPTYSVFETVLKLGVLLEETAGSVYEAKFELTEWHKVGGTAAADAYKLKHWVYTRATPQGQPGSPYTGDTARVQYIANGVHNSHGAEAVKIWTTTTTSGISDPNISYIAINSAYFGQNLNVSEELANKVSVSFRYLLEAVSSSNPRTEQFHSMGFAMRIGSSWLSRVGEAGFEWVGSETICRFQFPGGGSYVWNTIEIPPITVPETGLIEFRLYQLILAPGAARDKYAIQYDDVKISISQNDSLQLEELSTKAVTDAKFSRKYQIYETHIGDAVTNMSSSAIRLNITDNPVSELWSRDGVEELPLMWTLCHELSNLMGRKNHRILSDVHRIDLKPYQKVEYDGKYWLLNAFERDYSRNVDRVDLFDLGDIVIPTYIISYELLEYDSGGVFVDANMRIFVNDVEEVAQFGNGAGSFEASEGDSIRVQYFYLDLSEGSPSDPTIELLIDGIVVESKTVVIPGSDTFNYVFELTANTTILVRSNG